MHTSPSKMCDSVHTYTYPLYMHMHVYVIESIPKPHYMQLMTTCLWVNYIAITEEQPQARRYETQGDAVWSYGAIYDCTGCEPYSVQ